MQGYESGWGSIETAAGAAYGLGISGGPGIFG